MPPLIILVVSFLLQAIPGAVEALRYQADVAGSQPWRLVTGHWVHLGWMHLVLNGAGIALLAALFSQELKPADWIAAVTLLPLLVSCGFLAFNPELQWYVGLSGVLHGLMLTGCLLLWSTQKRMAAIAAIVVIAKLAHEQWAGAESGTEQLISGEVIVDAHLYGAVAGIAWGMCRILKRRFSTR
jgi:rhomboid family GlyGly-CTERM serine protease